MPFKIEEAFEVHTGVQQMWEYLIDPARVAECLPGAELLESRDDGSYIGAVKVKVGPVAMSYKGTVKFTELDEQTHTVRLVGDGREAGGGGSAKLTMISKITALANGGSQVTVQAEVDLVGKIVQFGRGMIEEVSRQLFRQFATCVKQRLEVASADRKNAEGETKAQGTRQESPETEAVSAVPLAFRALWAVVARFFKRLFGSQ
ncbi:MAG TPA: SRPBCC family protein [Blastocatellia bacterium]|nr:SRPBCC family protein [Blastocatellia bacterium]